MFNLNGTYALDDDRRIATRFARKQDMEEAWQWAARRATWLDVNGPEEDDLLDDDEETNWWYDPEACEKLSRSIRKELLLLEPFWADNRTKEQAVCAFYEAKPLTCLKDMTQDRWSRTAPGGLRICQPDS
jgi:hypothetical protein